GQKPRMSETSGADCKGVRYAVILSAVKDPRVDEPASSSGRSGDPSALSRLRMTFGGTSGRARSVPDARRAEETGLGERDSRDRDGLTDRRGLERRILGHQAKRLAVVGAEAELVNRRLVGRARLLGVARLTVQADERARHLPLLRNHVYRRGDRDGTRE